MVSTNIALILLQLIGLTLPAIGIYMQVVYGSGDRDDEGFGHDDDDEKPDIVMEGVYHQARLAVLSLLFGAIVLLAILIVRQPGDVPFPKDFFVGVHAVIYPHRLVVAGVLWLLLVVVFAILYFDCRLPYFNCRLLPKKEPWTAVWSVLLLLLFVTPIFVVSPIATLAIFPIALGLAMFGGLVAFEDAGRNTEEPIRWGLYEFFNHLIGKLCSRYSGGNRFFPPPVPEEAESPDESSWLAVPKEEMPEKGSKDFQADGKRYRIEHIDD